MIRVEFEGSITYVRMYCDICGERIDENWLGLVVFDSCDEGQQDYKFVHKGECDHQHIERYGDNGSFELSQFFTYLFRSFKEREIDGYRLRLDEDCESCL